jgi:hypothetical protein
MMPTSRQVGEAAGYSPQQKVAFSLTFIQNVRLYPTIACSNVPQISQEKTGPRPAIREERDMKTRTIVLSGLAGLLLSVSLPAGFAQAQQAPAGQPDALGHIGGPGVAKLAPPPPAHACLQLHNGGAVFNFNLTFNPNVTGFPITGGKITGSLCDAAQWTVTGGHLGPNLTITATSPGGGCATQLTVAGTFGNPSSYTGTYGFPGTGFQQHTLFLGYRQPTSPCP